MVRSFDKHRTTGGTLDVSELERDGFESLVVVMQKPMGVGQHAMLCVMSPTIKAMSRNEAAAVLIGAAEQLMMLNGGHADG